MSQQIEASLEQTRRRLLDVSRRNRLLNHKPSSPGALQIVDELPAEVFRILVGEGRRMQFRAREEAPADSPEAALAAGPEALADPGPDLPLAPVALEPAARHTDRFLQTPLDGVTLQKRLVALARKARSALEEQGCNILYLTLGLVAWREAGTDALAPLVFVPVALERPGVNSRHGLRTIDEDVLVNPCLLELAQRHFQFALPSIEIDEEFALDDYFEQVRLSLAPLEGWSLDPGIALGAFSFAKYLMYRDLDPANWPAGRGLAAHPLIRRLSGFEAAGGAPAEPLPDPRALDRLVPPRECFQVLDADASQAVAVLAAKQGQDLVIEGPPGTGKSQTITNIIAELLAQQKSVLFVAEKAAALDVVRRRLAAVGLGEFVLELHSKKTSKRAVLDELRRTLERTPDGARPPAPLDDSELLRSRERLNATCAELHDPLGALAISPFEAIARAVALREEPEARCRIPDPLEWSAAELDAAERGLEALDRRLERTGDPLAHPWRGCGRRDAPLVVRQMLRERRGELAAGLEALRATAAALAGLLGVAAPATPGETAALADAARELAGAPVVPRAVLEHPGWGEGGREEWLATGARAAACRATWSAELVPQAGEQDWSDVLLRRRMHRASIWRWLRWSWHADGRRLRAHHAEGRLPPVERQLELLAALVEGRRLAARVEAGAARLASPLGEAWRGLDSDWTALQALAACVPAVRARIEQGTVEREAAARWLGAPSRGELEQAAAAVQVALDAAWPAWEAWLKAIESGAEQWIGSDWPALPLDGAFERLAAIDAGFDSLQDWVDYQAVALPLCEGRLRRFLEWAGSAEGAAARGRLARTFLRHFYRLWIDQAFGRRETLRAFRGEEQQALIERFAAADRGWIAATPGQLVARMRAGRPGGYAAHRDSKLGLVQAEIRKKRRHLPLRRLFAQAGEAIGAIKPCWMMSPISVAQYLEPGGLQFDVVIFDEASQVEPADGYGAIARARQAILVGDEKQLPPTSFFQRLESDNEPVGGDGELAAGDLESILSLGVVRLPRRCRLRWHYRSRHESLIAFSNAEFYDGELRVFPGPHTGRTTAGLSLVHVAQGVYRRGKGQDNPLEARAVAEAVIAHALQAPQRTLGVGAFSVQQQQAIEDEFERLRREGGDPRLEAFLHAHEEEPFFVKNLETIQGDERDCILLSVGYGPDEQGKLTMNFGPLNREGGWRRLNVLVTRARRRCVVYSSIRADQIDLEKSSAPGVVALKRYLEAAEHGAPGAQDGQPPPAPPALERDVQAALEAAGWQVRAGVGVGRFALPLAVVDPDHPERYLAGIECDGECYREIHTARDRDRLRRQVLEGLGWRIEQVWAADWFGRREQALGELLARLNNARRAPRPGADEDPPPAPPESATPPPATAQPEPDDPLVPYYRRPRQPLGDHQALVAEPIPRLAELVAEIVADEAPIHVDEVLRVITGLYATRGTKRPRAVFEDALELSVEQARVLRRGEFLWRPADQDVPLRRRDGDCPVARAELIAPEELAAAVRLVLARAFGIKPDALVESTARLIGFARRGKQIDAAIGAAVALLRKQQAIREDEQGFLTLA